MKNTIQLIAANDDSTGTKDQNVIQLANHVDTRTLTLEGVDRIELNFPKFTDGRAYSQAFLLRRRLGFKGELRAIGDVLADQVVQMQRSGFDSAVLRPDQDLAVAQRQLTYFASFYQSDAVTLQTGFARTEVAA